MRVDDVLEVVGGLVGFLARKWFVGEAGGETRQSYRLACRILVCRVGEQEQGRLHCLVAVVVPCLR